MKSLTQKEENLVLPIKDMPIGTLCEVCDENVNLYDGHILLITYSGAVSLTNPEHTWIKDSTLIVKKLPDSLNYVLPLLKTK